MYILDLPPRARPVWSLLLYFFLSVSVFSKISLRLHSVNKKIRQTTTFLFFKRVLLII